MNEDEPDFKPAGAPPGRTAPTAEEFEQRFLEFAFTTTLRIDGASVAYALKLPIAKAAEQLEELAARDVLLREVDDEGLVYFRLPGRPKAGSAGRALVKATPPGVPVRPTHGGAGGVGIAPPVPPQVMAGLVLNLVFPGLGSIVMGKTSEGITQLVLLVISLPLCLLLVGVPMCVAVWGWALATSLRALKSNESAHDPASPPNED
jgi:hypothetical protein